MRPKERRDSGQSDLFKARLDQIIDLGHPLTKLAASIDWGFLEHTLGAVYTDAVGQPPLPTRLMAGLAILKHMHDLSDEALCARWLENPYYQLFCGEEFFRHKAPFEVSEALQLSTYFHDLGVFLHFQSDQTLSRTLILQPIWALKAVHRMLDR